MPPNDMINLKISRENLKNASKKSNEQGNGVIEDKESSKDNFVNLVHGNQFE